MTRSSPFVAIGNAIKGAAKKSVGIVSKIPKGVSFLAIISASVIMVCIAMSIAAVAYVLVAKAYPNIPSVRHSEDFESFMANYMDDLLNIMCSVRSNVKDVQKLFSCGGGGLPGSITTDLGKIGVELDILMERPLIRDEIVRYLKYYRSVQNPTNILSKFDLRNEPELCTDGDIDADVLDEFMEGVFAPLEKLREAIATTSQAISDPIVNDSLPQKEWYAPHVCKLVSEVHTLHLYLNIYFVGNPQKSQDDIYFMYQSRKTGIPMGMFTLYYWPYVKDIFSHRIPNAWTSLPENLMRYSESMEKSWIYAGRWLVMLPCKLAYNDPAERTKRCAVPEGFTANKDDDVVETLNIFKEIKHIVSFVKNLKDLGIAIAGLFKDFAVNPLKAFIRLITIIIGSIIGLNMYIIYQILTITGAAFVVIYTIAIVLSFGEAYFLTGFNIFIALMCLLPFLLLWIIDMMTNNMILRLIRCENLPDAWQSAPGAVNEENKYMRLGLMCVGPCRKGFLPRRGLCMKQPDYIPTLCPQVQICRAAKGKPIAQPTIFDKFTPNRDFMMKTAYKRQRALQNMWSDNSTHIFKCESGMKKYDFLSRHVCANIDHLELDYQQKEHLQAMCNHVYCKYMPESNRKKKVKDMKLMPDRMKPPFCSKCTMKPTEAGSAEESTRQATLIAASVIKVCLTSAIMFVFVISIVQSNTRSQIYSFSRK